MFLLRKQTGIRPLGRRYSSFFSSKPGGGRHSVAPKQQPHPNNRPPADSNATCKPQSATCPALLSDRTLLHPTISPKEYKLHHFFSLHRPLLLLNQPPSAIFEATDLPTSSADKASALATLDDPPESSPDADADAARQLAHTLVANSVGSAIAWQQTLSRLGLDADCSESMALAKQSAQEWVTIHADSTRRKKRKKMKKHKLKKRRRLTRRQSK